MKRIAKRILFAAAIAAVANQSAPLASACGGRGGRTSYAPVYSGYARPAVSYRASLPVAQPIHTVPQGYNPIYGTSQQSPMMSQPVSTPTTAAAVQQPRPGSAGAMQASAVTPSVVKPQTTLTSSQGSAQPVAGSAKAAVDAEMSALSALAALAGSRTDQSAASHAVAPTETRPAAPEADSGTVPAASSALVGSFQATLPSNVTIELNLGSGSTFSWIVRSNGKTTQFSGQYRISEGRLTLVRSNDLQQMAGKMTTGADGFTFQLDGANNGGLDFKKV